MTFLFRCRDEHTFEAEGQYSQFDQARKCEHLGCNQPAFMLVQEMAGYNFGQISGDRAAYFEHNKTYTGGTAEVSFKPNEHQAQCQCDRCKRHRRRAYVTETAEPLRKNKRVAKEVRV